MTQIERLAIFPIINDGDYLFRCSISNKENIMIFVFRKDSPNMMIRFFTDSDVAQAFVEECKMGKHQDE